MSAVLNPANTSTSELVLQSQALVDHIASFDAPMLGQTLHRVLNITEDEQVSVGSIAQLVLRDPGLTARVLRAANSVLTLRAGSPRVTTVSRALVLLGVSAVRSICAAALMAQTVETAKSHNSYIQVAVETALHAAVQAKHMAQKRFASAEKNEQAFIDSLLQGLGEITFWAYGGKSADEVVRLVDTGLEASTAFRQTVGMPVDDFNRSLLEAWGITAKSDEVVKASWQVAKEAHKGWESPAMSRVSKEVGGMLGLNPREATQFLRSNLENSPFKELISLQAVKPSDAPQHEWTWPDDKLQLQVMGEMLRFGRSKSSIPSLLSTCLEGMHRAVGLDRVLFAMRSADKSQYKARLSFGFETEGIRALFQSVRTSDMDSMMATAGLRVLTDAAQAPVFLRETDLVYPCMFCMVKTHAGNIGFFYGDRFPSKRALDEEAKQGFRLLAEHFEMMLGAMTAG